MATSVTNKSPGNYVDGGNYEINGGVLSLSSGSGILAGGTANATASVGRAAGEFDISLNANLFSATSGDSVFNLKLTNTPPKNFLIKFDLGGDTTSATATYSNNVTTVSATVTSGALFLTSSLIVNVTIPGNPYNLKSGTTNIALPSGDGHICYCAGTLIETPRGQIAVEHLSEGDEVYVFDKGTRQVAPLKWVGHKHVVAKKDTDRAIRICSGALDDNVPFKDLLVTPEHCLFIEGRFIPARMLVNGRSIRVDDQETFSIYHIETKDHAIVMADGALAESYLDTGNRQTFQSSDKVVFPSFGQAKNWDTDSAAPLEVGRSFVEPLFRKLLARAETLGFPHTSITPDVTNDPELHLLTEAGTQLELLRHSDMHYLFRVPVGITRVWLASNASMPSATIGPFVDDRRSLGVLVGPVQLFQSNRTDIIKTHLETENLAGWYEQEATPARWTAGMAELPISTTPLTEPAILAIKIITAGPYVVVHNNPQKTIAA